MPSTAVCDAARKYVPRFCPTDVGTLVWAKKKLQPPWPAIIVNPPDYVFRHEGEEGKPYCIYFFGKKSYTWVLREDMQQYDDKTEFIKQVISSTQFKEAVREIEEYECWGGFEHDH